MAKCQLQGCLLFLNYFLNPSVVNFLNQCITSVESTVRDGKFPHFMLSISVIKVIAIVIAMPQTRGGESNLIITASLF